MDLDEDKVTKVAERLSWLARYGVAPTSDSLPPLIAALDIPAQPGGSTASSVVREIWRQVKELTDSDTAVGTFSWHLDAIPAEKMRKGYDLLLSVECAKNEDVDPRRAKVITLLGLSNVSVRKWKREKLEVEFMRPLAERLLRRYTAGPREAVEAVSLELNYRFESWVPTQIEIVRKIRPRQDGALSLVEPTDFWIWKEFNSGRFRQHYSTEPLIGQCDVSFETVSNEEYLGEFGDYRVRVNTPDLVAGELYTYAIVVKTPPPRKDIHDNFGIHYTERTAPPVWFRPVEDYESVAVRLKFIDCEPDPGLGDVTAFRDLLDPGQRKLLGKEVKPDSRGMYGLRFERPQKRLYSGLDWMWY